MTSTIMFENGNARVWTDTSNNYEPVVCDFCEKRLEDEQEYDGVALTEYRWFRNEHGVVICQDCAKRFAKFPLEASQVLTLLKREKCIGHLRR